MSNDIHVTRQIQRVSFANLYQGVWIGSGQFRSTDKTKNYNSNMKDNKLNKTIKVLIITILAMIALIIMSKIALVIATLTWYVLLITD